MIGEVEVDNDEKLIKSMEICQSAISRLANNAFSLKAWFLVAFSALFTFFAKSVSGETEYAMTVADLVWLVPMLMFPLLDAFYLKQERMFRAVYDDFKQAINGAAASRIPFDLKPTSAQRNEFSLLNVVFSISVGWFYLPMLSAFQALVIYHTDTKCPYLQMSIFPAVLLIASTFLKKKTAHQS